MKTWEQEFRDYINSIYRFKICNKCGREYISDIFCKGQYVGLYQICSICEHEKRTYCKGCPDCDEPGLDFICEDCKYD